ncbi:hypothetical protein YC2023_114954 [Brassica napus]
MELSPKGLSPTHCKTKGQHEGPTHRPKTQKVNRRGNKLQHIIFHVYDRPAINEHGSRRGTTSFQVTELRRQQRRTTEEPIFTRARTEEPKEVGGGGDTRLTESKKAKPNTLQDKRATQAQLVGRRRPNIKTRGDTRLPKTQKVNRRGNKLRHIIFHVYDRPTINEHGSRRGTTSFQVTELRRRRRRTTEEPIFTRARTEELKEVGGEGEIQDWNFINRTESKRAKPNTLQEKRATQAQLVGRRRPNTQAQNTKASYGTSSSTCTIARRSMNTGQDEEPLPSRRRNSADGEDEPRKNQSSQGLEPKSQNWWIYESEKEHRRLQSILQFRLSCMKRSGIFEDKYNLEDAKTKSIGEKNRRRYRARGSRSTKS